MSVEMMAVLQIQVESLTRQVETLAPENERVRKLLTEFDLRHDKDQAELAALTARAEQAEVALAGQAKETERLAAQLSDAYHVCAEIAEHRHEQWREDGDDCAVNDDISACLDIANAIRAVTAEITKEPTT